MGAINFQRPERNQSLKQQGPEPAAILDVCFACLCCWLFPKQYNAQSEEQKSTAFASPVHIHDISAWSSPSGMESFVVEACRAQGSSQRSVTSHEKAHPSTHLQQAQLESAISVLLLLCQAKVLSCSQSVHFYCTNKCRHIYQVRKKKRISIPDGFVSLGWANCFHYKPLLPDNCVC